MRFRIVHSISLLLVFAAAGTPVRALEPDRPRDSWNVELLGRGIVCSLNGEVGLGRHFALGGGFFPMLSGSDNTYIVPLHVSWLSHSNRGLYLSAGTTFVWHDGDSEDRTNQTLSYGFQAPMGERAYFRFTLTRFNLFEDESDDPWDWDLWEDINWPGVTFGWRF